MNHDAIHLIYALVLALVLFLVLYVGIVALWGWIMRAAEPEIERQAAEFEATLSEEEIQDYAAYAPYIGRRRARKRIERMREETALRTRLIEQRHLRSVAPTEWDEPASERTETC